MKRYKIVTLAAVAVLGLGALGGAAVRANASSTPPPATSPAPAIAVDQANTAESDAGLPDTDNVQEGDQTTPDATAADQTTPDTAAEAAGEQAGSETPGNDGPGGHADEPGNANADHQFEGEE